jgi:hypothetical protein
MRKQLAQCSVKESRPGRQFFCPLASMKAAHYLFTLARKNERSVVGLRKSKLCKMAANVSFKLCLRAECFGDATLFHKFLKK